jgi:deoxycytidylate deaminase
MIHAEQNLCALFNLGDKVELVAVTLEPCPDCLRLLMAHGVKKIVFRQKHASSSFSEKLAAFYNVELLHVPSAP